MIVQRLIILYFRELLTISTPALIYQSHHIIIQFKVLSNHSRNINKDIIISINVLTTVDIKCDVSAYLIARDVCYRYRPGPIRADAFRGHGLSLLEKTTLRGLRTRAIPAGVTALLSPGLVKLLTEKLFITSSS